MTQVLIGVWLGCLFGLLVTPRGRDVLALWLADTRRVLGFGRGDMGRRWHELAAAEDAADPALRRARAVKDAYLAGEFGYDELDWRILLALVPPLPDREARVRNWELAQDAMHARMDPGALFPTHSTPWSAAAPTVWPQGGGGCVHRPEMQEIGKPPEAPLPTDADPRLVYHHHW